MLKQFFKDSFLYGIAGLLSRGISIILLPLYTRILSPVDFGIIDLVVVFASFVNVLVPLGISSGIARYYPDAGSENEKISYASSALWFTVAAYAVFALAAFSGADALTVLLLGDLKWRLFFQLGIISIITNGIFYFFQNLLRWQLQSRIYILSSMASTLITAAVAVFAVIVMRWGVVGIIVGQIAGASAGSMIAWYANRGVYSFRFDLNHLKLMLVFSIPIVPALIGEFVTNYIDRIAIRSLLSITDLGLYGIGFRFASVVSLLMMGFNSSLTPLIYNNYKKESTPHDIARIFRFFLILALPLLLIISLFAREILLLFTTPQYYSAWKIIPILSLAFLLLTLYNFAPGMDINKKTKLIAAIHLFTAFLNTALNFFLIPFFGIIGSALATMLSALFSFVSYMIMSQRLYFVPHNWLRILSATVLGVMFALSGVFIFPASTLFSATLLYKLILVCFFSIILLWVLFGRQEIRTLLAKFSGKLSVICA
jgi:O-antigen/teichoic acid export membrane protein